MRHGIQILKLVIETTGKNDDSSENNDRKFVETDTNVLL